MSKKTVALIIGLIALTLVLLAVALRPFFLKPSTPTPTTETSLTVTPTPPAYTSISLTPDPLTLPASGLGTLEAVVDTRENELTTVQLEIAYDPNVLTNVTVTPGDFFTNPLTLLNSTDKQTGRITYSLAITPAQDPVKGQGVVARITFEKVPGAVGQTQVDLLPKTGVTQFGTTASVLKESTGATVIIPAQSQSPQTPITNQQNTVSP